MKKRSAYCKQRFWVYLSLFCSSLCIGLARELIFNNHTGSTSGLVAFYLLTSTLIVLLLASVNQWVQGTSAQNPEFLESEVDRLQKFGEIGMMSAGMAHNFRNYLGVLEGTHSIIRRASSTSSTLMHAVQVQSRALDQAKKTVDMLMHLVKQDTSPGSAESGRPFRDVVEESVDLAEVLLQDKHVVIERNLSSIPAGIKVSDIGLMQSLINILKNAAEASTENGRVIISSSVLSESQQKNLCISVRDFGKGFEAEGLRNLFRPLSSNKTKGTGLGLMTVKRLVENDGGKVEVYSKPNEGTEVILKYPVHDA